MASIPGHPSLPPSFVLSSSSLEIQSFEKRARVHSESGSASCPMLAQCTSVVATPATLRHSRNSRPILSAFTGNRPNSVELSS
jgi:hypothetical protein